MAETKITRNERAQEIACHLGSGAGVTGETVSTTPNNSATAFPFNETAEELYDPYGMHDISTNPERVTILVAGVYKITASSHWPDSTTGVRLIDIYINGTLIGAGRAGQDVGGRIATTAYTVRALAVNDYVDARIYQTSGGDLAPSSVTLSVELVGG